MPAFLNRIRTSSHPDQEWANGSNDEQQAASVLRDHITREWQALKGTGPTDVDLTALTRLIHIHTLDVDPGGIAEQNAKDTLRQRILEDPTTASTAWNTLVAKSAEYAAHHQRADRRALQQALTDAGIDLQAPRSYREDIERLKAHTATTLSTLVDFSRIHVNNHPITISRAAATDARTAASQGHLLILGNPGAGKSGALYDIAHTFATQGADTVLFAVDQLDAASTGSLRNELGLAHELTTILNNWPGTTPGFFIIDALDAARSVGAARTFQTIMEQVISSNNRWRVIASVRKFDLRYNTKVQALFRGTPPTPAYADTDFSTTRHVNIPALTDNELAQFAQQAPRLNTLVTTAPPALRELVRIPFNLRLLAELLSTGLGPADLQPLTTQTDLLDRYWQERIIRNDVDGDAREVVLRRTTDAMVHRRALSIPRTAAMGNEAGASKILNYLLSAHVLAEWTTKTGSVQREILTFPHHLLFDYAVARSITPDHAELVARLRAEPDLLLAIRPSIELHYRQLWHDNPASFWDLTFQAIRASMPEIGKLIGPSVAALQANTIAEYQPLLERLNQTIALREDGIAALRHVLNTFLANATSGTTRAKPWCALIDAYTTTMTLENAGTVRPSVWYLAEQAPTLDSAELSHLGAVARRLLKYALSIAPDDHGLLIAGIVAVNKTASCDPTASIALLRECITPERLQSIGYRALRWLADGVITLSAIDGNYVHDLYLAALRHQETSEETTSMNNSQIMAFNSRRRQDYQSGLHQLGQYYAGFLQQAPSRAVATLRESLDIFAQEHHHTSMQRRPVSFDGIAATLVPDRSRSWDGMGIYAHDLPVTMLTHFQVHLQTLAAAGDQQAVQDLLNELIAAPVPGVIWRRFLLAGTHSPTTLGQQVRSLAWDPTILTGADTTITAGTFIRALHPTLDAQDRVRVEQAILATSANGGDTQDRDRLLGCLDPTNIVSTSARDEYMGLLRQGGPPANSEDAGPHWGSLPSPPESEDALTPLLEPVTTFIGQYLNAIPDATAIAQALHALDALHNALTLPTAPISPERERKATVELLRAATRITRAGGLTEEQCTHLVSILLPRTTHHDPVPDEDDDQQRPVTSWSDEPRLCAAEGLSLLVRYQAACTPETRDAIKQLSTDLVRAVRAQIANHVGCLYATAPDLCWELLGYYATHEQNPTMLVDVLHTLRRMPSAHATRTAALAARIFDRAPITSERNDVRDACIHVFCALDLYASETTSTAILDQFINGPVTYTKDVHRLILDLSVEVTAADRSVRERTFTLVQLVLTNTMTAMDVMAAAHHETTPWPADVQAQYGALLQCADEIAQRLYFASGAFKNPSQDRTFLAPDVFYAHARPLLTQLARVGYPSIAHHILETLQYFIPIDPAGVLILAGEVVRTGSKYGYQYESLAEGLMVDLVEQYLAEYRPLLRERPDCHRALMDILDVFVRVGWPRAHQLTYQLGDIYR